MTDADRYRRTRLKQLAALGFLGPAGITGLIQEVLAKGDMPTVNGVNALSGNVTVNGVRAEPGTVVKAGDKVSTGPNSMAVVVIGKDGFLLRDSTSVTFQQSKSKPGIVSTVLLTTGKLLSVFARRVEGELVIKVPNASIGIRGTGCYLEAGESRTYFCLCYGQASVTGAGMAQSKILNTTHHENPVWLDDRGGIMKVEKAGFVNHNDDELIMLEKLNGREPPFVSLGLTGKY
ncbi:MAG: hypothetical protein ABI583_15825 [Betaproteobacteria bacterium]